MSDPSFILKGIEAKQLRDMAQDLQALLDARDAAIEQPVSAFGELEGLSFTLPQVRGPQQA